MRVILEEEPSRDGAWPLNICPLSLLQKTAEDTAGVHLRSYSLQFQSNPWTKTNAPDFRSGVGTGKSVEDVLQPRMKLTGE